MAMERKKAVWLFSAVALLVGFGLGWLVFGMNKGGSESVAGKPCKTTDGKDGKTDSAGVCKA